MRVYIYICIYIYSGVFFFLICCLVKERLGPHVPSLVLFLYKFIAMKTNYGTRFN